MAITFSTRSIRTRSVLVCVYIRGLASVKTVKVWKAYLELPAKDRITDSWDLSVRTRFCSRWQASYEALGPYNDRVTFNLVTVSLHLKSFWILYNIIPLSVFQPRRNFVF